MIILDDKSDSDMVISVVNIVDVGCQQQPLPSLWLLQLLSLSSLQLQQQQLTPLWLLRLLQPLPPSSLRLLQLLRCHRRRGCRRQCRCRRALVTVVNAAVSAAAAATVAIDTPC